MRRLARVAAALLAGAAATAATAPAASAWSTEPSWVAAWGMPINSADTTSQSGLTVREVVRPSIDGTRVRVRLSNASGSGPVTFRDVHAGVQGAGAAVAGANVPLSFGGSPSVTVPAGQDVLSDPAELNVTALKNLLVSAFVVSSAKGTGDNEIGNMYTAPGDHAADAAATAFGSSAPSGGYYVSGLDTWTPNDGAIAALGDSITAGYAPPTTTNFANAGWPYWLADRLAAQGRSGGPRLSVIDLGISGNQVTRDLSGYGASAEHRLGRDVLRLTGLRGVLMMEGINDIGDSGDGPTPPGGTNPVPTSDLEAGLASIVARVHAAGVGILLSPLTPAGDVLAPSALYGPEYWIPSGVQERFDVNNWIRHASGAYAGGFDFDGILADAYFPNHLAQAYNSGDNLHPNLAGQQAMAASVDLAAVDRLAAGAAEQ